MVPHSLSPEPPVAQDSFNMDVTGKKSVKTGGEEKNITVRQTYTQRNLTPVPAHGRAMTTNVESFAGEPSSIGGLPCWAKYVQPGNMMIWNLVHQASREIKRQAQGSGGILLRVVVGFHTTLAHTILSISQSKHILKSLVDFFFFFLLIFQAATTLWPSVTS